MFKFHFYILSLFLLFNCNSKAQEQPYTELSKLNKNIDSEVCYVINDQFPRIGISASRGTYGGSIVSGAYIESVLQAGGAPIIVPAMTDAKVMKEIVKDLDGLILIGGDDIDPTYYGEIPLPDVNIVDSIRDIYDLTLVKLATDRNIPVLGICRGEQLINVAFGGSLYQDIPKQFANKSIEHKQTEPREKGTHVVTVNKDSKLANILSQTEVLTNSYHHQAVKEVAPHFIVSAKTSDGMIEAIEAYPNRSILGVQWHPESHAAKGDTAMQKIFGFIVDEAKTFKKAKELHKKILSVDTHCDTPLEFKKTGFNIRNREENQVNIPKMEEGMLDAIFFAAYTAQGPRDAVSSQKTVDKIEGLIKGIHKQVEMNKDICGITYTTDDLIHLKSEGKKAIFIGIENGYGIGKDIKNIEHFQKMGVNYITLCHTKDNDICDTSSKSNNEWNGLSPFGREVIKEMNRLGMMIDVSHAGEKTFWDVIELSTQPIIASHSSAQALCYHDRNLTDKQMKAIAKNGGVIQICLVDLFINKETKKASVMDAIDHIDHAIKVAGIDHVGIASDFDGGGGLIGCMGSNDMINITVKLIERGYTDEEIAKIWGGNFLRVMDQVQSNARK